ncbi:hypothetical protein ACFFLM_06185 [Deinococcus oregonensis]|uniref:Uncharacterized protein n=1 Tax=Deinococcus oregonensis TaxID=1805970 RepID=A0ABV6AVV7_9DEIO
MTPSHGRHAGLLQKYAEINSLLQQQGVANLYRPLQQFGILLGRLKFII